MELPIELFLGGMGISIALAIFGFLRQPQIPAMLCFGGMFMLVFAVATDTIIINSFGSGLTDNQYSYNVESFTGQLALNNLGNTAHAEFVSSSSSQLLGAEINCIDVLLRKALLPTGIAEVGTLDANGLIVQQFGTIDVATLTTSNQWKTFCLSGSNTYIIQNQDRLGVKYSGGDAANNVQVSQDANNPFDGVITFRQQFATPTWTSGSTADLTMRFYLSGGDFQITDNDYEFTELPKTLFALMGSIFMLCGALMVLRNN